MYFAKWLPVEGEINSCEKSCGNVECKDKCGFPQQKVKLFLCSRYINIGDKCRGFSGGQWFDVIVSDPHRIKETYKIIGEISTEATWVKEGDEFEESQIRCSGIWVEGQSCNKNNLCTYPNCKMYRIKGPCCHFH